MISFALGTIVLTAVGLSAAGGCPQAQSDEVQTWRKHLGDPKTVLEAYFAKECAAVNKPSRVRNDSAKEWKGKREERRRQFREMLGLDPLPARTPLQAKVTGTLRDEKLGITVDNLHFQSMPGLYVTANLYRPSVIPKGAKLPAILYLCGHGKVKVDGYSYGNKTYYMHHPTWFARNGYVCLVIDTLQLGEIEGAHHGTFRLGQWWWVRRGYTPAGVEAWNASRSVDYLCSLPEVDAKRIGVTGRSGGGVGTWHLAAIDERPAALVPVAGLTDLANHVQNGCIENHCDCNYFINYYRWDFGRIAALSAPRPLLLANSDNDGIFPLDGVMRLHAELKDAYGFYGAKGKLGLLITPGRHGDTPELRVPAFRWMGRFLKGEKDTVVEPAAKHFEVKQLRVFDKFPKDERNRAIQYSFVPYGDARPTAANGAAVSQWRRGVMARLMATTFRAARVPEDARLRLVRLDKIDGVLCRQFVLDTGDVFKLPLVLYTMDDTTAPVELVIQVATELPGKAIQSVRDGRTAVAVVVPRGLGLTRWPGNARKRNHLRRRFLVLGRTLSQTRIHDARAAMHALRRLPQTRASSVVLRGADSTAEIALFATILEPGVTAVHVSGLPKERRKRLALLGLNRVIRDEDIPALVHPRRVRIE